MWKSIEWESILSWLSLLVMSLSAVSMQRYCHIPVKREMNQAGLMMQHKNLKHSSRLLDTSHYLDGINTKRGERFAEHNTFPLQLSCYMSLCSLAVATRQSRDNKLGRQTCDLFLHPSLLISTRSSPPPSCFLANYLLEC